MSKHESRQKPNEETSETGVDSISVDTIIEWHREESDEFRELQEEFSSRFPGSEDEELRSREGNRLAGELNGRRKVLDSIASLLVAETTDVDEWLQDQDQPEQED